MGSAGDVPEPFDLGLHTARYREPAHVEAAPLRDRAPAKPVGQQRRSQRDRREHEGSSTPGRARTGRSGGTRRRSPPARRGRRPYRARSPERSRPVRCDQRRCIAVAPSHQRITITFSAAALARLRTVRRLRTATAGAVAVRIPAGGSHRPVDGGSGCRDSSHWSAGGLVGRIEVSCGLEYARGETCPMPAHGALEHEVEQEGVVVLDRFEHRHGLRRQEAETGHFVEVEQGRNAGQGIVGAVEQPIVPVGAFQDLAECAGGNGSPGSGRRRRPGGDARSGDRPSVSRRGRRWARPDRRDRRRDRPRLRTMRSAR